MPLFRFAGGMLITLGVIGLLDSFVRFAVQGVGTPAPVFPTRHLVVTGLYRYVRNPMYVAVVSTILGQGLILGNVRLLEYGGLVWLLKDFEVGSGWGLIDGLGEPKPCWYALKRALRPRQVLITDEGVNGLAVHVLNEDPEPLVAELRLAVFAEEAGALIDVRRAIEVPARGALELSGFELTGRFFDLSYAYRFGPRTHELVVAQLITLGGEAISEAHHLLAPPKAGAGEVAAELRQDARGWTLALTAERLQPYVHIADPGFRPSDDGFLLVPGETRQVRLSGRQKVGGAAGPQGELLALGGRLLGAYGQG